MKRGFKAAKRFSPSSKSDNTTYILLGVLLLSSALFIFMSMNYNMSYEKFTSGNIDKKVRIEYYYKDGCPHCDIFKPMWEKISNNAELLKIVEFKSYDIKLDGARASKFEINSIPEVIAVSIQPLSSDKELIAKFDLDRTEDKLIKFIKDNA
jgi:thiol-disulfide isomerase/thioredoxin